MRRFYSSMLCLALVLAVQWVCAADDASVRITRLTDSIWVHTSYFRYGGILTPSNGVIAVSESGLVLVDTPWTPKQTRELLVMAEQTLGKRIALAVITHAHQDRIGGITVLNENGIETVSTAMTAQLAAASGYLSPRPKIDSEGQPIVLGGLQMDVYYPGPAHTRDNIVVYFPQSRVLFGGCIVKALGSGDLGNLADGEPAEYSATVQRLLARYPEASWVIPGHGDWGTAAILSHTLKLAEKTGP